MPSSRDARETATRGRRLAVATPLLLGAVLVVYALVLWPWLMNWGATPDERARSLPGDGLAPSANFQFTRAVTVRAPAAETWRWLVQIGQDRAGFYSYTWLENLVGAQIRNADRVHAEWQQLRAGDLVRAIPPGYLNDALEPPGWRVESVEPGHWFVLRNWGVFLVEPVDATTSRLIVRTRFRDESAAGPLITVAAFGPVHFVMERRMLLGIKERAEGRRREGLDRLDVLDALAAIGFVGAAVGVVAIYWCRARRRPWVTLPAVAALAVMNATGDVEAGLAAFVSVGLTALGVAAFRRHWPVVLLVPPAVLLVLLSAPDAYHAFGLFFLGGGVVAAVRAGPTRVTLARRQARGVVTAVGPLGAAPGPGAGVEPRPAS